MTNARFPGRVYGVGAEPDPRLTLANERERTLPSSKMALPLAIGVTAVAALVVLGIFLK